jgi:hypothetical protein
VSEARREAEAADEQHRVTQRGIRRATCRQRSHDEYESRMKLYVRPTFDRTPLVKVTKAKLIELRNALKSSNDPISNATINTLFASLSSAYSYFVEQGWCSETRSG